MILCYRAWLKLNTYWKCDDTASLHQAQFAVQTLLREIIKSMPRTTDNNWELPKIHEQLHVPRNIHLFGSHNLIHTGPQEHNHIEHTKNPSKQV